MTTQNTSTYSAASAALHWPHDGQALLPLDFLKPTNMPARFLKNNGLASQTMETSAPLPRDNSPPEIFNWLQQAFLASLSALQGRGVELATVGTYGRKLQESLATFDPPSHCLRTSQACLQLTGDESLTESSVTWPRSGMMLSGTAFRLAPLVRITRETGSGSFATPQARDYRTGQASRWNDAERSRNLNDQVAMFPTPTSRDHKDTGDLTNVPVNGLLGRAVNPSKVSGSLNPQWVEWLMGYPSEWTGLNASATQ